MKEFKNINLYDWVNLFQSLSRAIYIFGQNKVTRNEILKEKAKIIFGETHPIYKNNEIDPLSFIYSVAQKNTVNQKVDFFQSVIDVFELEVKLPTDWYFPTPTPNTKTLYYTNGNYVDDSGTLISVDVLWELFFDTCNKDALNINNFKEVLSIKNVGVVKLTQTLFLINPKKFLPIDERTITILPISVNHIKEIKNFGLSKYEELLLFYGNKFPECFGYEINLFLSQFTGKGKNLALNHNFCQVSTMVDGQRRKDYYEDFVTTSSVRAGSSGDHKTRGGEYPLDKVFYGDIVLIRRGTKNMGGIGVILYNEYLEGGYEDDKSIKIIWINKSKRKLTKALGDWNGFSLATPNTLSKFKETYLDTFELLDVLIPRIATSADIVKNDQRNMEINKLNQILFGPPGTGKTYNTINKALSILENKSQKEINVEPRNILKARFDNYIKNGKIVFTTFHQSMSYEDFIEGIKPLKPEDEDDFVKYDIQEGIFKGMCRQAMKEFYQKGNNDEIFERLSSFENGWNELIENVQNSFNNNTAFPLDTISGQAMDAFELSNRGNLYLRPQYEGAKDYTVSHDRTEKLFEAFPDLEIVKNIDKAFRSVIGGSNSTAYWSVLNYINTWLKENPVVSNVEEISEVSDILIKFDNKVVKENIENPVLNYVIIIDEINRGNVSQILGELITLIEEDKRLGSEEALEVKLPYSKENFGVPPNLYIIGTMNTADRSVEALDTALRRRFSFEEMMPISELLSPSAMYCRLLWTYERTNWSDSKFLEKESQLFDFIGAPQELRNQKKIIWKAMKLGKDRSNVSYFDNFEYSGCNLQKILDSINKRLEILFNRDHLIGHSYFLNVRTEEHLKAAFQNNIIPLLQEYFYGDYEKIGLILGSGFFEESEKFDNKLFASFGTQNYPDSGTILRMKKIDEEFDIVGAIDLLLNV